MKSKSDKLIEAIKLYMRKNDIDNEIIFYTIEEWKEREEKFLNDSEFVITSEGGLYYIINYGDDMIFEDLVRSYGYFYEMGHSWSYGFYKDESSIYNTPVDESLSYSDKLKDIRWKHKSQKKMDLAKKQCEDCNSTYKLEIHHCYYRYGFEPWEYPLDSLRCLCSKCHKQRHSIEMEVRTQLAELSTTDLKVINSLIANGILSYPRDKVFSFIDSISDGREVMEKNFEELIKSKK